MSVKDKSVYLDNGNGNYLNLFNSGKIGMLWTGPWDLSSINKGVDYGVALLPGYNGNHETISGPDLWMAFDHSAARTKTTLAFMKWLTSPSVHMQYAMATGNLPIRKSETQLPGYQDFLKKYPGNKVFVQNLDNVKHVRPNIASYGEISTAIGQMVQSVLIGKADPQTGPRHRQGLGHQRAGRPVAVATALLPATAARRRGRQRAATRSTSAPPGAWSPRACCSSDSSGCCPWRGRCCCPSSTATCRRRRRGPASTTTASSPTTRCSASRCGTRSSTRCCSCPPRLVLSLLVAAALNRRVRGISFYRLAVFVPVVTSTVATGVIFTWLLDPNYGIVNALLAKLGGPTPGWFSSPDTAHVRRGDHDRVGLGRLRRPDLPRRPAGHPPGPDGGGPDRRLHADRGVLADPGAAAPTR